MAICLIGAGAGAAGAQVLYVGDSLGVGTAPVLREALDGVAIDVDAKTGRPSGIGVEVLASTLAPEHEVVVFDLGTNDDPAAPEVLASDLAAAREIAGDRCLVVATLNRPPLNGVGVEGLNRTLTRFALATPGVELVDWHGAVRDHPGLLFDGVHAVPEGYALRARLFADAIGGCLTASPVGAIQPEPPEPPATRPQAGGGAHGDAAQPPAPRRRRPAPLHVLATELAKSVAVGAEFG